MKTMMELEIKIARFLRWGVMTAGGLMLLGWVLAFTLNTDPFFVYQTYDPLPLKEIWRSYYATGQWGQLLSLMGLCALILLPVVRVMLTTWLFIKQRDRLLAFIAFVVLLCLTISFSLGVEL